MKKSKMLLTILLILLTSCKSTPDPTPLAIPEAPAKPEIIEINNLQDAGEQIAILVIQEFIWRQKYLDIQWILGLVTDEYREEETARLQSVIDKLTKQE